MYNQSSPMYSIAVHVLTMLSRIFEDEAHPVIDVRTDTLQTLRELGPPDLVHLIKQPIKSTTKQVP